jgi:hypothetical protein
MLTNQNLLATPASQMLIVCHPDYLAQATELANWHIAHDGLSVQIVTTVQIFNEFGSGVESPTAIRDYVRLIYNRSKNKVPGGLSYLLLLGDGNYNNRYDPESVTNFVPTYQSDNSLYTTLSFVSDDYYGLLDEEEGGATGFLDIGIGRLPARSTLEAQNMVDKIKRYYAEASMGTWRRQIAFVADDGDGGDGSYFMRQSEEMANSLLAKNPQFAVKKIYLDAYPQIATAIATESPQTNSEIDKAVSQGSLLINYVGHGSENGWTDEKILTNSQIESYTNSNKLAVFMTATCEFSRFDNPMHLSSGERLLQNPKGGAAALFTTTRLVYAYPNEVLNREFFNYAFLKQRPQDQLPMRLGDILRSAKIAVGTDNNKRNFTLLGDPAMPLSIPKYTVQLDQINQQNLGTQNIQIRALETVSANGSVRNGAGEIQNNFTGTVDITVYDRFLAKQTLGNDAPAFNYLETENNLYRTTVQVKNGLFNFNFIVPKDIRYETGPARMSFYAQDATTDAWGGYNKLLIGSTSDTNTTDTQGPEISIHFYDANSRNGGYTGTAPILYVILADPSGINTLGTAIGHDLKITIDNDPAQTYIVNAYYVADGEDFSSGKLIYQLPQLTNGTHSISLKAWDNRNNSSTADATFIVSDASAFTIFQLSNYPNPVHESTTFEFTHNRPNEAFTSTLSVYNTSGQIVAQYTQQTHDQGNTHHTFTWNARTLNGQRLAAGVYPYKIQVHTSTNEQATFSGKLTIAP